MSSELININIIIADRPYPLKIKPAEEEKVRQAAREINDKIRQFQNQYAAKDKQDYLAMCALMYAVDISGLKDKASGDDGAFTTRLSELEKLLEKA